MVKRVAVASFLLAASLSANELLVDKRTLPFDDTLTISLSLDGDFASIDPPRIPVQNLVIDGAPSVSSEFQWINGATSRKKVFRYLAHARAVGAASVGPLTLRDSNGVQLTLPIVAIDVIGDASVASNDPVRIMRELVATSRDPIFVMAQADKSSVFEGEEVVVTWTLYNGASVQQYSLGEIPKLDHFWTEELNVRSEEPQDVMLGGVPAQKLVIRRAALFPLRSGSLTIGPMALHASVMKRRSAGDPFGLFEGEMSDVHRRSSPITIVANATPAGPPVIAVTNVLNATCGAPSQRNGGPVVFDLGLSGRANLRSVRPPSWQRRVDGEVQIVDRGVKVFPVNYDAWMTRRWRYIIFPAHGGSLTVPALAATYLTPAGERREVRCEAKTIDVMAAERAAPPPAQALRSERRWAPIAGVIAAVLLLLIAIPRMRRQMRLRGQVRSLVRETPSATRDAVEAALVARGIDPIALLREASDRGDAFRAFRSLIDAAEHDRISATPRDIAHRVRDLLVATESGKRGSV